MLEDYWLPVRDGKGADVDTLPSGELTGVLDDVLYFQKKLYNALNVPVTRLNSEDIFSSGKATEITRAEIKFARFIFKLRTKFCDLFLSLLEKQLILKNKITYDEWDAISGDIRFEFIKDNYFSEYKDIEVNTDRANLLMLIDPFVGKYYSAEWVRKFILKQSQEDIDDIDKEIKDEADDPQVNPGVLTPQMGPDGQPSPQGALQNPQNMPPQPPAPGVNPGPGGSPAPPGGWAPSGKKASPKPPSASKKKSE